MWWEVSYNIYYHVLVIGLMLYSVGLKGLSEVAGIELIDWTIEVALFTYLGTLEIDHGSQRFKCDNCDMFLINVTC